MINLNHDIFKIIEKLQPSWNCQFYLHSLLLTTKPGNTYFSKQTHKRPKESPKLLTLMGDPSSPQFGLWRGGEDELLQLTAY